MMYALIIAVCLTAADPLPKTGVLIEPKPFADMAGVELFAAYATPKVALPPAAVPTLPPSQRLGDPAFVGPHVLSPLSVSADGKIAVFTGGFSIHTATGWVGHTMTIWDVAKGQPLRTWDVKSASDIGRAVLSGDGKRLYTGGDNDVLSNSGVLKIADVSRGKLLHQRDCISWALSGDDKTLATLDVIPGSFDRGFTPGAPDIPWQSTLALWNATDLKRKAAFTYTGFMPRWLSLSADGKRVACSAGRRVFVIEAEDGHVVSHTEFPENAKQSYELTQLVFAPDGRTLAIGNTAYYAKPRGITMMDTATGEVRTLLEREVGALLSLEFTPDSRTLAAGFDDAIVMVDAVTGTLPPLRKPSPDAALWRTHPNYEFSFRGLQPDEFESLHCFRLADGGRTAIIGGRFKHDDCGLRVVDVATRKVLYPPKPLPLIRSDIRTVESFPLTYNLHGNDHCYPGEMKLDDGRILNWSPNHGHLLITTVEGVRTTVSDSESYAYLVSADQETLIMRNQLARVGDKFPDDPHMHFRDLKTLKEWGSIPGPNHNHIWHQRSIVLSPDGRTMAAVHDDGAIWLYEVATLKPRVRLDRRTDRIHRFQFSRDGRQMLSNDFHGRLGLVWELFPDAKPGTLTAAELAALWADLIGDDGVKAYRATGHFAIDPASAVPFLNAKMRALDVVTGDRLQTRPYDPGIVIARRAVEALERCGTPAAAAVLKEMIGLPYARPLLASERMTK